MKAELGLHVEIKIVDSENEANALISQGWNLFNTHAQNNEHNFTIYFVMVHNIEDEPATKHIDTGGVIKKGSAVYIKSHEDTERFYVRKIVGHLFYLTGVIGGYEEEELIYVDDIPF